jgi:tripartite-type tricarboxylate transporter receptor subunit TctC
METDMQRRILLGGALMLGAGVSLAQSENYPDRPLKLVIPFAAGGSSDVIGRLIANELAVRLKQPVVVVNAPGAGGMIALQQVLSAPADGYTLLQPNASTLTMAPQLMRRKTREPWLQFAPISTLYGFVNVLVAAPGLRADSLKDLIRYAKANPGRLSFASPGVGTTPHLLGEQLKRDAGIEMTHVAYKGAAPALTDVMAGQVDLMFEQPLTLIPLLESRKLKALAIAGSKRHPSLPAVPTVGEQGMPSLALQSWAGIVTPLGTPNEVVAKLSRAINEILAEPSVREAMTARGVDPMRRTIPEFDRLIRTEYARWTPIIQAQRIYLD